MAVTLLLLAASTAAYVVYARVSPEGPRGGSVPGMLFGIAGSLLMLFAGLLSLRKRFPKWRLGSAQFWLRGHLWLGLLSGPLILFHAGFRWGGLLEQIVLALALVIILSGIVGLVLQSLIPRLMKEAVPAEAMFEQLPVVCARLQATADAMVNGACGPALVLAPTGDANHPPALLAGFYRQQVRAFLDPAVDPAHPLRDETRAGTAFHSIRQRLPADLQLSLDQLEQLCTERRKLLLQDKLHRWLHGWLLLHVPLSAALLVFAAAHIVTAMWY
jgi:hypothetical protein